MMKLALLGAVLAALVSVQAQAAITLASMGQHSTAGGSNNPLTTASNACAAGSTIVVQVSYATTASTLTSVTDSAGNTYQSPIDNQVGTGIGVGWAYAINTGSNVPIGGTVTANFGGTTLSAMQVFCIQGLSTTSPLDTSNHTANGLAATSASSVATGTLANSSEIVMGTLGNPTAPGTVTCGGSYTKVAFNGTPSLNLCYQVVSATTSVAFAPTWVNTVNYVTDLISFQAPGAGPASSYPSLSTLGVGP